MSILTILRGQLDSLTLAEREIAGFVLDAPEEAIRLSSAELAQRTGRSQSSVVKFCQKQGFRGYQDFKVALTRAASQTWRAPAGVIHGTIDSSDNFATTLQKLLGAKIHAIQETLSVNEEATVQAALDAIRAARRIQLVGMGASSLVARDLAYKLQKLGYMVLYDPDSHIQIANAVTLNRNDIGIVMSFSGNTLETCRIAETAAQRGAKVISVTGVQPNRLAKGAAIRLFVVGDELQARSSAIFTRDAQLALTDLLFILLVQSESHANALIQAARDAVESLKI
ncbi:MurR/RpiR family transcriptional regulator [Paracoccus sp. (in: a-proteobacteria)]|uniref:MurR/RpiR family transcriptional regulator n=1 Tax=Paracoccus sp. TaxID=267 RepID=UPI003A896EFC